MTIAQKFPDDLEDVIYQSLLSEEAAKFGMSVQEIATAVEMATKTAVDPEAIFRFIQRMDCEGMVEKVAANTYKGVKYDPMWTY